MRRVTTLPSRSMDVFIVPQLRDNLGSRPPARTPNVRVADARPSPDQLSAAACTRYLVRCGATGAAFFVDIAVNNAKTFMGVLETHGAMAPSTIVLTTHKHADHAGGNEHAKMLFHKRTGSALRVYGDMLIDKSPGCTHGYAPFR
jgi:glyoxylase-like metal-dependent hydrolase (beta-lactamase superfamily II)